MVLCTTQGCKRCSVRSSSTFATWQFATISCETSSISASWRLQDKDFVCVTCNKLRDQLTTTWLYLLDCSYLTGRWTSWVMTAQHLPTMFTVNIWVATWLADCRLITYLPSFLTSWLLLVPTWLADYCLTVLTWLQPLDDPFWLAECL